MRTHILAHVNVSVVSEINRSKVLSLLARHSPALDRNSSIEWRGWKPPDNESDMCYGSFEHHFNTHSLTAKQDTVYGIAAKQTHHFAQDLP
jgi:hypothetical protein